EFHGSGPAQNLLVEQYGDEALNILLKHNPEFEMRHKEKVIRNDDLLRDVEHFRDTYHLYMWTSNTRELIDWVLANNAMSNWFDKIVTRNDVRFLKPSPEGFDHLYDRAVPKKRYVLIGDSSHDRSAALAAGIDFYLTD